MGKITVKHYLNKSQSKKLNETNPRLPVYVQVTVKRQVNRMRSQAHLLTGMTEFEMLVTQKEFDEAIKRNYSLGRTIALERKLIEDLITFVEPFDKDTFSIKEFALMYQIASESVLELLDKAGKDILLQRMEANWIEVFYMLDLKKPFTEIVDGLVLLGQNNKVFLKDVLSDKYLQATLVALNNLGPFTYQNYVDPEGFLDYTSQIGFYWFKKDLTKKFLNYLLNENRITSEEEQTFHELFKYLHESVMPVLKGLSGAD